MGGLRVAWRALVYVEGHFTRKVHERARYEGTWQGWFLLKTTSAACCWSGMSTDVAVCPLCLVYGGGCGE